MTPSHEPHPGDELTAGHLPCGAMRTDADQRITQVNPYCREWLGYAEEELLGRRFYDLLTVGGKLYFESHHRPHLEMSGKVQELSYQFVARNGDRLPAFVNGATIGADRRECVYVIYPAPQRQAFESQLIKSREDARQSDRARANFLSTMSHEVRTPLHAIVEASNFLLKDSPRQDQLPLINALRSASGNLLHLVNDILDLSKMDAGEMQMDNRPFHAVDLLNDVMAIYGPQCHKKGLFLKLETPEGELPAVLGDRPKFNQVLTNLVSNAVKFTAQGGIVIRLLRGEVTQSRCSYTIEVRDTGMGIPQNRLAAIFNPFVQVSAATFADFGGTGLGLAICQRILRAVRSELKVESTVGEGSAFSFTLRLPIASAGAANQLPDLAGDVEALAALDHIRVANVDDNDANLLINARYFEEWKLDYHQFKSGPNLLSALETEEYDLILTDLHMPKMSGYDLAEAIRRHPVPKVANLPIIALSASVSQEVSPKVLAAGIDALVTKPFEPYHLHGLIQQRAEEYRARAWPAPERADTVSEAAFDEVRAIFGGNEADFRQFLGLIVKDLDDIHAELKLFRTQRESERYRAIRHNTLTSTRLFHQTHLNDKLDEGLEHLKQGNTPALDLLIPELIRLVAEFRGSVARKLE